MADARRVDLELPKAPQVGASPKRLWEVFPAYSLSSGFEADEKLVATLEECYAPRAIKLRTMFITYIEMAEKDEEERAKRRGEQYSMRIADDLFNRAGSAFEAHLRNCSLSDLRLFTDRGTRDNEDDARRKLAAFFRPRDGFDSQSWESMRALLIKVWEWARAWRLDHYVYVHFGCLALIEGHWFAFPPLPAAPPMLPSIAAAFASQTAPREGESKPPSAPKPQSDDFVGERTPDLGWIRAERSMDSYALKALGADVPNPPAGFPPYRGRGALKPKEAQKKYAEACKRQAEEIIRSTLLAKLGATHQAEIIARIGEIGLRHAGSVDREYNRKRETPPGRYWRDYERDLKWTAQQVIFRRDWPTIARKSRASVDVVKKAVRRTLSKLYLPYVSVERENRGQKRGKSGV